MSEKKRGRPKSAEISIWDKKYYRPSEARDIQAIEKLKEERLYKGYLQLYILAFGEPKTTRDLGLVNRAVAGIINDI